MFPTTWYWAVVSILGQNISFVWNLVKPSFPSFQKSNQYNILYPRQMAIFISQNPTKVKLTDVQPVLSGTRHVGPISSEGSGTTGQSRLKQKPPEPYPCQSTTHDDDPDSICWLELKRWAAAWSWSPSGRQQKKNIRLMDEGRSDSRRRVNLDLGRPICHFPSDISGSCCVIGPVPC